MNQTNEKNYNDISLALYRSANDLRKHQDNLRWTVSAGYLVAIGTLTKLFIGENLRCFEPERHSLLLWIVFAAGVCLLAVLAVESWYYNVYSDYVKHCEHRLLNGEKPMALERFTAKVSKRTTPFHFSFFFVLSFFALANGVVLYYCVTPCSDPWARRVIVFFYWILSFGSCRYWNNCVYGILLTPLKRLFQPR
jgi:hypothetical protein